MERNGRKHIDIALSGGGTRAALYSGGALVAVQEAVVAGKVEVGAIHAVSGSALLVARIILASDGLDEDADRERDLQLIKDEVEAIARYGFMWSPIMGAVFSGVLGMMLVLALWSSSALDGASPLCLLLLSMLALMVGAAFYQLVRRSSPFNLNRGRPRSELRSVPKQGDWFAKDHLDRRSALPTSDVRFVCTSLKSRQIELVDPWREYLALEGVKKRAATLADCAGASAAVPIYSSAVRIGLDLFVDGGALDNLGCRAFLPPPGAPVGSRRSGSPLVVDSSVLKRPTAGYRDLSKLPFEFVAMSVPLVVGTLALPVAASTGVLGRSLLIDLGFYLLAVIGILHFMSAYLGRELLELYRALRAETSIGDAMMRANRRDTLRRFRDSECQPTIVELCNAPPFAIQGDRDAHDLRTRLSAIRGDTAVELVRASYRQTADALGVPVDSVTERWLDELRNEIAPTGRRSKRRELWRRSKAAVPLLALGWGYNRYWFDLKADDDGGQADDLSDFAPSDPATSSPSAGR